MKKTFINLSTYFLPILLLSLVSCSSRRDLIVDDLYGAVEQTQIKSNSYIIELADKSALSGSARANIRAELKGLQSEEFDYIINSTYPDKLRFEVYVPAANRLLILAQSKGNTINITYPESGKVVVLDKFRDDLETIVGLPFTASELIHVYLGNYPFYANNSDHGIASLNMYDFNTTDRNNSNDFQSDRVIVAQLNNGSKGVARLSSGGKVLLLDYENSKGELYQLTYEYDALSSFNCPKSIRIDTEDGYANLIFKSCATRVPYNPALY